MSPVRFLLGLLCLAACGLASAQAPADDSAPHWRIVLIRSWDSQYPVNVMREQALRQALLENAPRVIDIFPEEIDPLRFPAGLERELVALLEQKYRETRIDAVVASGLEPLHFATKHRDRLWPGAAIVFNGVVDGMLEGWKRPPRVTGVTMQLDVEGTLDLGLALVPDAKRVYLVAGNAPFDRMYLELATKAVRASRRPLEPHPLVGLSRRETMERLAAVEPGSLVLYLTILRDADGQVSGPGAPFIARLAQASAAPMLSAVHTQFGRGPLGGSSARFDLHGQAAGLLVRRILDGADPDAIAIRADPRPFCQVDWNGLARWKLAPRDVPSRCEIVNAPASPWKAYFWPLVALVSIILLQAGLLWALALQSRQRRRAEGMLALRSAEMAQVARVSTMGALTASIAHEINQPMGAILSNAEAALLMLDQGTLTPEKLRAILTDIRDEDVRASEVIRKLRSMLAHSEWKPQALELNAEVAEALSHVALDAARRGVRISPRFDSRVPAVMGDSVQLQQVIINLVLNAMDAAAPPSGDPAEVRVETHARPDGAEIAVLDRGPGVPPERADHVFHFPFTTKKDGMGFGLSIVRTIVEMHRGRVSFEANVPRGAIFRVWLPAIGA
jgi:signal transduction histidine kinase